MNLVGILLWFLSYSCQSKNDTSPKSSSEFEGVNSIAKAKCAHASCHGAVQNNSFILVDRKDQFSKYKVTILDRINISRDEVGAMPPVGYLELSPLEKQNISEFLTRLPKNDH